MKNSIEIKLGLNEIVFLQCLNDECKHNYNSKCNLKNIIINKNGICCNEEKKDNKVRENMFPRDMEQK